MLSPKLFPPVLNWFLLADLPRPELSLHSLAACQIAAEMLVLLENMMFS